MKPRTLAEAMKAMDEAEALVDKYQRERDEAWERLIAAREAEDRAIADFNEFTARNREERRDG